jgi:hypothetical protein
MKLFLISSKIIFSEIMKLVIFKLILNSDGNGGVLQMIDGGKK